jgi:hypothetical protein
MKRNEIHPKQKTRNPIPNAETIHPKLYLNHHRKQNSGPESAKDMKGKEAKDDLLYFL